MLLDRWEGFTTTLGEIGGGALTDVVTRPRRALLNTCDGTLLTITVPAGLPASGSDS